MRTFLLLLLCLCCAELPANGYAAFRMDLMQIPESAEKNPETAIRHSDTRCALTVFMNILSGTRAELKLYDRAGETHCGFSMSATPSVLIPQKRVGMDFSVFFRKPGKDTDSAVALSAKRNLRVPKPVSCGLFAMPGAGAVVPLLRADTLFPFYGATGDFKILECRLIEAETEKLKTFLTERKLPASALEDPLPSAAALEALAAFPAARNYQVEVNRLRGKLQKDALSITVRPLTAPVFRLTVQENCDAGGVTEEFFYEGCLLVSREWLMVAHLRSPYAGKKLFFEQNTAESKEKILLVRAEP